MDRKVETRPPALIEGIVRRLTPPVSREYVLGDLSERFVSTRSYVADALRTIPFVVGSRIRRIMSPLFVVGVVLIWGCIFGGPIQAWPAAIIPTLVCSALLLLRDVYRPLAPKAWFVATMDIVYFVAAAAATQVVLSFLAPQWKLSADSVGVALGLTILFLLRVQVPAGFFAKPSSRTSMTMGELAAEIHVFEKTVRRAVNIELGVCCIVVVVALVGHRWFISGATTLETIALAVIIASVVFVGSYMYRYCRIRRIPVDLGFELAVDAYRVELEYRCRLSNTYVWWYLLPLSIGPTLLVIGTALKMPSPPASIAIFSSLVVVGVMGLWAMFIWIQRWMIRRTRERIEQLSIVTERIP